MGWKAHATKNAAAYERDMLGRSTLRGLTGLPTNRSRSD